MSEEALGRKEEGTFHHAKSSTRSEEVQNVKRIRKCVFLRIFRITQQAILRILLLYKVGMQSRQSVCLPHEFGTQESIIKYIKERCLGLVEEASCTSIRPSTFAPSINCTQGTTNYSRVTLYHLLSPTNCNYSNCCVSTSIIPALHLSWLLSLSCGKPHTIFFSFRLPSWCSTKTQLTHHCCGYLLSNRFCLEFNPSLCLRSHQE